MEFSGNTVNFFREYRKFLYLFRCNSLILKANRRPKEKVIMILKKKASCSDDGFFILQEKSWRKSIQNSNSILAMAVMS